MKHRGKVEKGLLVLFDKQLFNIYLKTFEGKHIDLIIKLPSKDRSNQQNKLLWAMYTYLAEQTRDRTKDEWHKDLAAEFLKDNSIYPPRVRSTTSLSTSEFAEYIESIIKLAAEYYQITFPSEEELKSMNNC